MEIVYKETKEKNGAICGIRIALESIGNNRRYSFSITGDYIDDHFDAGGCIHELIEEFFPEYSIFIPLHSCDSHGASICAVENGMFNITRMSVNDFCKTYRIKYEEYIHLKYAAEDKDGLYYRYLLYAIGIEDRWREEAKRAICMLEELTNKKFVDEYKNYNIPVLTDKTKEEMQNKIHNGYYSIEQIKERMSKRKSAVLDKCKKEAIASHAKAIEKAEEELKVMLYAINKGIPTNHLYYHSNIKEGHFCEKYSSTEEFRVTKEMFDEFVKNLDYSQLPEGIKFIFEE